METPSKPSLPQTNEYPFPQFYIRKCYEQYYLQALRLLQTQTFKFVSVTGTKGIGKSIFYQYVFTRIRENYPNWVVITASFTKNTRRFKNGIVFYPNGSWKRLITFESLVTCQFEVIDENLQVIALYDGAPEVEANCKMICFTSYDASWFAAARDMVRIHATLYMPVWTLDELKEARTLLRMNFTDEQLAESYDLFGGVPRVCFLDSRSIERQEHEYNLLQGIQKIESFAHLVQILGNKDDPEQIPHRLFQFLPFPDSIYKYFLCWKFEPISHQVYIAISKHLIARSFIERIEMLAKLDGISKASSFYGFLFEAHAHDILIKGDNFQIRSLDDSISRELDIAPNSQIEFIEKKSYADYADQFIQIPIASNFLSCDSWFVDVQKRIVVFFQVTSSYYHPVSYDGLEKVLLKLSAANQDIRNYEKILLFVVSDTQSEIMSIKFTKQKIEVTEVSILPDAKKDILFKQIYNHRKETGILQGFGEESFQEVVASVGIDENFITLQDVHSKIGSISTRARNLLNAYFVSISDAPVATLVKQYVLGLDLNSSAA
jgi:hypothetical protein